MKLKILTCVILLSLNLPSQAQAATLFAVAGEEGHNLYSGVSWNYTDQDGYFVANAQRYGGGLSHIETGNLISVKFSPFDSTSLHHIPYHYDFLFEFSSPGEGALSVGNYTDIYRYPFEGITQAGMSLDRRYAGCNKVGGSFNVLDIAIVDDTLSTLAIDFVHICEPGERPTIWDEELEMYRDSIARGSIRFNSDIPISAVSIPTALILFLSALSLLLMRVRPAAL